MTKISLEVESGTKPHNPYGPAHGAGATKSNAKLYFVLCLAFFAFAGMSKFFSITATKSDDPWADKGDAAGGWGSVHNHRIVDSSRANMDGRPTQQQPNVMNNDEEQTTETNPSYDYDYDYDNSDAGDGDDDPSENVIKPVHEASYYHESMKNHKGKYSGYEPDQELRQSDFYGEIWDLISIPTAPRPEYSDYQKMDGDFALAERLLFDMNTPHGKAFDFILNRDKRKISADDPHLIQRFVLALLFYATGGTDVDDPREFASGRARSGNGGWDSEMAHFLTGLHECHWVKKSMNDQFWGILNMEGDTDRRVGVTKCNVDMEVTEIRLADLNMVGFIPEEIKYLSSLESLDVQNNHLAGHIPKGLGELDELKYLSLDGNNFSGTIPDVFENLNHLERAYLNFNDFNGSMPPSLCTLREDGSLADLWSDCGGYPITCTCCTVCCDMVAECDEMPSQIEGQS